MEIYLNLVQFMEILQYVNMGINKILSSVNIYIKEVAAKGDDYTHA